MSLGLQGGSHLSHGHVLVFPYELRVRLTTTLYNMHVVCYVCPCIICMSLYNMHVVCYVCPCIICMLYVMYVPV